MTFKPITQSQIFLMAHAESITDTCCVCGYPTIVRFRDAATGGRVGYCCLSDLQFAERLLAQTPMMRHPNPNDLNSIPNN